MAHFTNLKAKIIFLFVVSTLFVAVAWSANKTVSTDNPYLFSGSQIRQIEIKADTMQKSLQLNTVFGQGLTDAIDQIKNDKQLGQLQREFLLMQSVIRLRSLLLKEDYLVTSQGQSYLKQLQSLSEIGSVTHRWLDDGNHRQIVKAFPFDAAAKSSIKAVRDQQTSNRLWTLMENHQYGRITNELPSDKKQQINLLKRAIEKLDRSKIPALLHWSNNQGAIPHKLPAESILLAALYAEDLSAAVNSLKRDDSIAFHRYFELLHTLFNKQQRFDFFKETARIKKYASASIYQISQLNMSDELKREFLLFALSDPYSGSSAAHVLSQKLNATDVDQLAYMIKKNSDAVVQKNALLTLLLSQNNGARLSATELYQAGAINSKLAKEVSPWFE